MTREEHLVFCKKCMNREFNITEGILCNITGKKADFETICTYYQLDKKTMAESFPVAMIKPNQNRATLAIYLICAVLIVDIFAILSNYFQYKLLEDFSNGIDITAAQSSSNDLRVGLISILYFITYIISAIIFIQWFRRAYNNLAARTRIDHGEGWAAGGWFVPFLCLYRPYTIMKELFEKTDKLISNKTGSTTKSNGLTLIGIWWAFWIVIGYIGNYSIKLAFKSDTIENLSNGTLAEIVSSALEIPIGILAIWIITTFAKKESRLLQLEKEELERVGHGVNLDGITKR